MDEKAKETRRPVDSSKSPEPTKKRYTKPRLEKHDQVLKIGVGY